MAHTADAPKTCRASTESSEVSNMVVTRGTTKERYQAVESEE